jgi:cellulose synthase/poly-beta-1,6-N-acetylglucosamine synthase-like glycosyltransferase
VQPGSNENANVDQGASRGAKEEPDRPNTATTPTLSIGLPVYNGEDFLRDSLESILSQDYDDFELIISDNASIDATEATCREFADPRRKSGDRP